MKLITKISRKTLFAIIGVVLFVNTLSGLSVLFSGSAEAAPPAGAHTIYGDSSTLCAPTLEYLSPGAQEVGDFFEHVAGVTGPAGAEYEMGGAYGQYRGNPVAQDTFGALYYNLGAGSTPGITAKAQNVAFIDFKGANGAGNSLAACQQSMVLFKAASDKQSSTFYGMWNCAPNGVQGSCPSGSGAQYKLVSATIKYSGSTPTLSFSLPNWVNATNSAAPKLGDPHSLLNDCDYFSISPKCSKGGGGGGSGGGGSVQTLAGCLVEQDTNSGAQTDCIDSANKTAAFTDIGHIYFDGETYDAGPWSGPSIHYTLDSSSKDKDLAALSPYFDVDTDNGSSQMDLNIDQDGKSQSQLQQFSDAILRTGKHRYIAAQTITYHTNAWSLSVDTDTSSLNTVATYYPSKDTIELNFTDGAGTNESHYYGKYTRLDATHYTLADGGYPGCGTKDVPQFIMDTDPRTLSAKENGITTATWQLWDNESPCKSVNIRPVNVFIADQSQAPPDIQTGATTKKGTDEKPTCESNGFSLSWIMCPIVEGIADAVNGINADIVQPLLSTHIFDTTTTDGQKLFNTWSGFRVYGDVFLVIALLVIVFGQSIGGGLIDAYTAKKVLPRLLAAAVLINLSFYIVSGLVDITNVVGAGLDTLIAGPFGQAGAFTLKFNAGTDAVGIGLTGAAIGGLLAVAISGAFLEFAFAFVLLPALLVFVAIMVTVLLRRGIILLLLLISPVAFALYCLPNTEKYFRQWWDTLFKALLVYPIIEALFAISKVLAVTINWGSDSSHPWTNSVAGLVSIAALIVPLFMIPFAFRIAGGILGKAHDTLRSAGKKAHEAALGNPNDGRSWRNRVRRNAKSRSNELRNNAVTGLASRSLAGDGSKGSRRLRRGIYSGAARALNFGNLQAERAAMNEEDDKLISQQYSMGDDANIRAYWAKEYRGTAAEGPANGRQVGALYSPYQNADGSYKEWSRTDKSKATSQMKRNPSRFQSFAKYEAGKVANAEQHHDFQEQFLASANDLGWSAAQTNGVWSGIKFAHQAQRKEDKYQTVTKDKDTGKLVWKGYDHAGLSNEMVDAMGRGDMGRFRSTTPQVMTAGYKEAKARQGANQYGPVGADGKDQSREDAVTVENYEKLAEHMGRTYFSSPQDRGRFNAELAAQAGEDGSDAAAAGGYGTGGSANAEAAWIDFIKAAAPGSLGSAGGPPPPPGYQGRHQAP